MAGSFAENFIAGHQAGLQRKQQEQAFTDAQEDRGIRKMLLDMEKRKIDIDEALHKREIAKDNFALLNGQPNADLAQPIREGQSGVPFLPQMPGGPSMALNEAAPPGSGAPSMSMSAPTTAPMQGTIAPVNIPGVEQWGMPGVSVRPKSAEEAVGQQIAAKYRDVMMTPRDVAPEHKVFVNGQVIAEGGPEKETRSIDVQAADALAKGDNPTYQRLMKVKNDMRPPIDPTLEAIRDATLANLRAQQANGALTPAQFRVAEAMADDYTKASTNYITQVQGYQAVQAAANDPSAAGDLAMVFAFMKTLDPTSTVREGEFANAQNATGIPDRIRNVYNRAATGERLNPTQRADFLAQSKSQFTQAQRRQQGLMKVYGARAKANGLPPEQVVIDYDKAFGTGADAPGLPKVGDTVNVNGTTVTITAIHPDGTFDGTEVKR